MNDLTTSDTPTPTPAPAPVPPAESAAPEASAPAAAPVPITGLDHDFMTARIAEMLAGQYHCGRAWGAWEIGTMTADDFTDLSESEIPGELATLILGLIEPFAQEAANWRHLRNLPTHVVGKPGQLCLAMRLTTSGGANAGAYLRGTNADAAVAESIKAERMRATAILDPSL